ncbi:cytochrome P450, partial [Vibrio cholerae]|uniref:cytochrome P450 n=3 Tax=Vibrio cholerae TaxID=666 RepID=UPI00215D4F4A
LKPILSNKYIDTWAKAADLIHNAQKVVVIGYSFNNADEHFNDIIRNSLTRKYDIVTPDVLSEPFLKRIEKVFGVPTNSFSSTKVQGKNAKTTQHIRLISAYADELDVGKLFDE